MQRLLQLRYPVTIYIRNSLLSLQRRGRNVGALRLSLRSFVARGLLSLYLKRIINVLVHKIAKLLVSSPRRLAYRRCRHCPKRWNRGIL